MASIVVATRKYRTDWLHLRKKVYDGLSDLFHVQELEIFLSDPQRICFLYYVEQRAVGLIEVTLRNIVDGCLSSPVGYIEGIFVKPDFRQRGIGKRLLDVATEWCAERGCTELATDSELRDTSAQKFHIKMGFEETYRIVQFKKKLK